MARSQLEPPLEPLEEMLAKANAAALADASAKKVAPPPSPPPLTDAQLEAMTRPELLALARRLACQCGLVAMMTQEETAQAMLDTLAETALRPIAPGLSMKADIQARMSAIDKWLDRTRGKPAQSLHSTIDMSMNGEVRLLKTSDKEIIDQYMQQYLEAKNELQIGA